LSPGESAIRRTYPHRVGTAVAALIALFGLTWLVGWVLVDSGWADPVLRQDLRIATWVAGHRTPWVTDLFKGWTLLASGPVITPTVLVVGLGLNRVARSGRPLGVLAAAHFGPLPVYEIVKRLVGRPRPEIAPLVGSAHGFAFPSGHSAQAAAVGSVLTWLILRRIDDRRRQIPVAIGIGVLSAGVLVSRVYLGVHWTSDVVAGAALGGAWAAVLIRLERAVEVSGR
jgi:membrane-associated phospholipid phosphatase